MRNAYADGAGSNSTILWGSYLEWSTASSNARTSTGSFRGCGYEVYEGQWYILDTGWYPNDNLRLYVSSSTLKIATDADAVPSGHIRTRIGSDSLDSPSSFFNGDIVEVLVYNRNISEEERNAVGTYLSTKYDLTTQYPVYNPQTCADKWSNAQGDNADFNKDCIFDFHDLAILASEWLLGN
jgi:hypothetical protein